MLGSQAMNLLAYQYNFVPNNAQIDVVYILEKPVWLDGHDASI